jgi:TRAP-type C4-dicarboxylate transport system permease large subunit
LGARAAAGGILLLLTLALVVGVAPNADARLVGIGERLWPGYAANLRRDPQPPDCQVDEIQERLDRCLEAGEEAGTRSTPAKVDPFAPADPSGSADPSAAVDPFAPADPFAAADPFGAASDAAPPIDCSALESLRERCVSQTERYRTAVAAVTPALRAFRFVELTVSAAARFPYLRHLLVLLVLLGAITASVRGTHIALRAPRNPLERAASRGSRLVAHLLWLGSCVADVRVQWASSAEVAEPELSMIWAAGFVVLAGIDLFHLIARRGERDGSGSPGRLLMVVPLYAWMGIIAGIYFLGVEHHPSGQAIFLHKLAQHPSVYIGIGLYIWAGMLLAETQVANLAFEVLVPWRLPPAWLVWLVVVAAAVPTAYSGASGIFVISTGAVLFGRLRSAGVQPRLALSAAAMSGSMGVVLQPCLIVVLIAVLNGSVTTGELFGWGRWVFALTAALFGIAMWLRTEGPVRLAPPSEALPASGRAVRALVPYVGVGIGVLLLYAVVLDTTVNEHTAAYVLPVVLLAVVAWDRARGRSPDEPEHRSGLRPPMLSSVSASSGHIGALLMVMVGSVGLGGVIERLDVIALVPESTGPPAVTMALLVVAMVLVGMVMDALGAVVLVSATIAPVAIQHGIHPAHFWMMVLVAFELGYLTPPVALNHLLARQVIGVAARVEEIPVEGGFFARYEHILVPMAVMGTALLLTAFVPLLFYRD